MPPDTISDVRVATVPDTDDPTNTPSTASDDVSDAFQAVGTMTTWVTHADTKAGLLAAAAAVVIAAIAQDRDTVGDVIRASGAAEIVAVVILACIGTALVVAVAALGAAVTPRTQAAATPTRFGLPTLATPGWTRPLVARAEVAEDAWTQAAILARIADRKFFFVRIASVAVTISLVLLCAWIVVTSLVT